MSAEAADAARAVSARGDIGGQVEHGMASAFGEGQKKRQLAASAAAKRSTNSGPTS